MGFSITAFLVAAICNALVGNLLVSATCTVAALALIMADGD
jgi:hypothetical protein